MPRRGLVALIRVTRSRIEGEPFAVRIAGLWLSGLLYQGPEIPNSHVQVFEHLCENGLNSGSWLQELRRKNLHAQVGFLLSSQLRNERHEWLSSTAHSACSVASQAQRSRTSCAKHQSFKPFRL